MASAESWDARYRDGEQAAAGPADILTASSAYWECAPCREALDVACGAGANAVYLAENGWRARAVDFSAEALRGATALAAERGVTIETSCEDLEVPGWRAGEGGYGMVVVTRFLHRPLFPALRDAVAPGGLLVYQAHTVDQLGFAGGPRNPDHLLRPNELLERFRDWRVLRYEEQWIGRATASLIARRPAPQQ
ncbi:MAG: methyltransferase domain-containing protein [Acidobacteria bacterium]|nr:methyltransferase domain-containing protein [Acidobacteriota bacterium]